MRCIWTFLAFIMMLNYEAKSSLVGVGHDLNEQLLPVQSTFAFNILPMVKTPSFVEVDLEEPVSPRTLPASHWQDIFYRSHHFGQQHFLICATDPELFSHYLAALMRLLISNPHCRVTFVANKEEHETLRRQVYVLLRDNIRQNTEVLRDLHFIDQPFVKESRDIKMSVSALNGDKYTAMLLACPRGDYTIPVKWLHNKNAMIYIPFSRDPKNIERKLHDAGFRSHHMIRTSTMICAATSDITSFPNEGSYPGHNPDKSTPVILRKESMLGECPECGKHSKSDN